MATELQQDFSQLSDEELEAQLAELEAVESPTVAPSPTTPPVETPEVPQQDLSQLSDDDLEAELLSLSGEEGQQPEDEQVETPEPDKGFWEEVGDISSDIGLQTISGFREGLIGLSHTILPMYGIDPSTLPKPREMFDAPEGTAGQVTKDVSRFVAGYTVGGAPLKGMGALVQGSKYVKALAEGSVRGFVGDYSVISAGDKTLSNLMKDNGADTFVTNALSIDENDSLALKKFKGATEGVVLGMGVSSLFEFGIKPAALSVKKVLDNAKDAELAKGLEDAFAVHDSQLPSYVAQVADDGNIVISGKGNRTGQEVLDDIQTAKVEDTVDRKLKILQEKRRVFEDEQKIFSPLKTSESLATRKEIKKDLRVAEVEIKAVDKKIVVAEKAFEEATKRLENAPIPKAIISGVKTPVDSATAPATELFTKGGSLYRELHRNQVNALKQLDILHADRLRTMETITDNKYLLRELTEDAQAAAAIRNKEALRIKGALPPKYEEIVLEDLVPLAAKKVDPVRKARVPKKISHPLQRLSKETQEAPLPTNEYDALVDDVLGMPRPVERIQAKLRELGSLFILRSADSMKSLARVSPTAARLSNMIRFDTSGRAKKAGQFSYTESAQFMSGKYKAKMKDALTEGLEDSDLTQFGNLTPEANKMVTRALRGVDVANIPEKYQAVAKKLRTTLTDFHKESGEKVPTGFIDNFFPRKWRPGDMHKKQDLLRAKLANAGFSPERIEEIERKIINEMEEDLGVLANFGDNAQDFAWKGSKLLSRGSRTLDIDELDFEEFLDDDVINVLDDYFEKGSRKITYNNMFGYNGEKVREMMEAIRTESRANGRPIQSSESVALGKLLRNLQGQQKFGNALDNVNEVLGTTMRVMHLGLATLISFGEAFIPFGKAPFATASKSLIEAVGAMPKHYASKILKGVPEPEAYAAAQRVNLALDSAAAERLSSLMGNEVLHAGTRKINNAFFKGTLLTEWVKMIQVASFRTGRSVIIDNLTSLYKGVKFPGRDKLLRSELEELGVDIEAGLRWVKGGKSTDHPFMEMVDRGALRFANDTALHPDSSVKPFIQSRPEAMLLTQFKAYPTAFANVVLRDWAQAFSPNSGKNALERATKIVRASTAAALIMGATAMGMDLREYIQYGEAGNPHKASQSDGERLADIMDASGVMGHAAAIKHAFDADRYNQEPVLSWFGPAFGKGINLVKAGVDAENRQDILAKEAARAIPNFLPTEILLRIANNDGSKSVREQVRASLGKSESAAESTEPEFTIPDKSLIKGGDLDLWQSIKDIFPDEFPSLFDDEGEDSGSLDKSQVSLPDGEFADEIAALQAEGKDVPRIFSSAEAMGSRELLKDIPDNTSAKTFVTDAFPAVLDAVTRKGSKLLPEVLTAITALETGWGKSVKGNSFFGVKSQKGDKDTVVFTTKEADASGELVSQKDSFKAFPTFQSSVEGVVDFLQDNPRYRKAGLFKATTAEEQIAAIAKAGFATDPNYQEKLTAVLNSVRKRIPEDLPEVTVEVEKEINLELPEVTGKVPTFPTSADAPAKPERPVQSTTETPRAIPALLDEAELAEESQFIDDLIESQSDKVDLSKIVQRNLLNRKVKTKKTAPSEPEIDLEELFNGASSEIQEIVLIKEAFPDATLEEIQEFLKGERDVSTN